MLYQVVGDLSAPLFGLSTEEFSDIALKIDRVVHNGCYVREGASFIFFQIFFPDELFDYF
jgi:hypothetical protein